MTNMRSVKVWVCVACLATTLAAPAPLQPTSLNLDFIDVAAISRMSPHQLEILAEGIAADEMMRTKRSSAQALTSVVSKASSGLQSKVGLLGQASAFISSASSKHGGDDEHPGYSYEPHDDKINFWGLKKSILYTLFQAVKAITGGVTILKGQLIKGGGHLATTLGKVIAVKGDAVSNLGKKIVSSAALAKKPHSTPVYGPPPPSHVEYSPSAYGAPTAPAHFSHTAPSAPTGYAAHKYPAHLDGRSKLNGVHAGVVILTPLGDAATSETRPPGHTPLEPPSSIANSVYSAIKTAFTPAYTPDQTYTDHGYQMYQDYGYQPPPPPPETFPTYKPSTWGAVNSYGGPAQTDAYPEYDPRHPYPPYAAANKLSSGPASTSVVKKATGFTPDKIQKIKHNLAKVNARIKNDPLQRSSEVISKFNILDVIRSGFLPPTPVVSDNEIGVLPAKFLPEMPSSSTTEQPTSTSQKPTSTSQQSTSTEKTERKDVKYYLRGNRIVVHG